MSRMMALLAVIIGLFQLNAGEPALGGEPTSILVPEPGYIPKVGDRAVLYSVESGKIPSDLWCATTSEACRAFIINLFADEEAEGGESKAQAPATDEKIVELAPKTEVQLLARESVTVPTAKEGMPLKCTYFSIQVLSGPFQGKTLYTLDLHLARLVKQTTGEVPVAVVEAKVKAEDAPAASAPAPEALTLTLESPEAPVASGTKPSAPVADAPASAPIPLETADAPPSADGGDQPTPAPLIPAPSSPAPLTLEPEAPAAPPIPPETLNSTTTAPPDAVPSAPGVLVSTPETSAEDEPPAPVSEPNAAQAQGEVPAPDSGLPEIPAPTLVSEPASESENTGLSAPEATAPIPQPAPAVPPLEEQAPAPPLESHSSESKPGPTQTMTPEPKLESDAIRMNPAVAPPAPAPALVETKPEPAEIRREDAVAAHPGSGRVDTKADSNPAPGSEVRASEPRILSSQAERSPVSQPRGLITSPAPALPRSAPELLTVASGQERAGKHLEALVAYRILERNHPTTPEAKVASLRIKQLTEAMELRSQEARASQLMKLAEKIEASGKHSLAFEYFQQVVKVYPTTPTARRARERLDATALKNSSLRR